MASQSGEKYGKKGKIDANIKLMDQSVKERKEESKVSELKQCKDLGLPPFCPFPCLVCSLTLCISVPFPLWPLIQSTVSSFIYHVSCIKSRRFNVVVTKYLHA